ncbi:MAG: hypothetical protein KHZ24_01335 [Coriobacteriia bacterium]|nr:hypothetical protein [Coriobacteriia bacterium]
MARYDYRCPNCDVVFEVSHGMMEHPVVTCPTCGTVAQRVFDPSGIVLKGSGFYNTDMRGKSGGTQGTSGSSESTELAKTSSGSKEIKKHDDGGVKDLAKSSDKPAKPAAAPSSTSADKK